MFMLLIKKQTAYLQRVFIPVFRYVKVIKIYQDFPELQLQMYWHLFYGSQCISRAAKDQRKTNAYSLEVNACGIYQRST